MPTKRKLILDKIGMLLLCVTIVTFSIIIGGNEKTLPILPIGILTGLSLIILLIKKIKYKEKLLKNKIDIAVLAFMGTTILPLIFKTYCTYQGTMEFILKYFFVYTMYLLARNVVDTRKKVNILISTTIISSLAIIIFGFDILNGKNLNWLYNFLDINYEKDYRFVSTFGYANTVSIYLTFCVFLAINRIENVKNILIKILHIVYIILSSYVIYISYSRFVLILYVLSILIYFGAKLYKKIKSNKKLVKTIIVVFLLVVLLFSIYLAIAMKYSKPLEFKINGTMKLKKEFEPNKEYTMTFDLDVLDEEDETNTIIRIKEVNKYLKQTTLIEQKLTKGKQTVELKFTPSEDVYYLKLKTINENKNKDRIKNKVIINKVYINNEEYICNYKYIPTVISRLINSFEVEDESIHQRLQFWENSLRIAKDSPIIGHGGNAWKRLSLAYEDYPYAVKETHSYFFELLTCYGIVGVIAFLLIIVLLWKNTIKNLKADKDYKKQNLSIFIGLMLLVWYSLIFDFTMSYVLTLFIVFLYIALLQRKKENEIKIDKTNKLKYKSFMYADWCVIASILVVFITLLRVNIARFCTNDIETKYKLAPYVFNYRKLYVEENCPDNLEEIQQIMLKEPYLKQVDTYKNYWEIISHKYRTFTQEELLKYIDFGIERFKKVKAVSPMYFNSQVERTEVMINAIKTMKKINSEKTQSRIKDLEELLIDETKANFENIKDTRRHYKSDEEIENIVKRYNDLLQQVNIKIDF